MRKKFSIKFKEERGITLIALIITIVIIFIISAVSINGISQSNIIEKAKESEYAYELANYNEQIREIIEATIRKYSITGEELSISNIANELNSQEWVESATANTNPAVTNEDIIVVTDTGYVFQVYYNSVNGNRYVEYIGDDGTNLINIIAAYDAAENEINVTTSQRCKIDIIFKGTTIETAQNTTTMTYTVEESGDYVIKATSDEKTRYAWLRISTGIDMPTFEITSTGEVENGWYGKDNVPVVVTVSGDAETTKGIYYKINSAENYTYVQDDTVNIQVNTVGKTTIYAYLVDNIDRESDIDSFSVKYDNVKPVLGDINVEGETTFRNWYTSDIIISFPDLEDEGSGIEGCYYWEIDNEENVDGFFKGSNKTITVSSIGTKKLAFRAKDKAGNLSTIQTITVKKVKVLQPGEMADQGDAIYEGIVIPGGFTVSNVPGEYESIDNGIVVYDIPKTDLQNSTATFWTEKGDNDYLDVQENYNQFVWVPVEKAYIEANESIATYTGAATPIYPMAVKLSDGNYRGILYDFAKSGDNVAITPKEYNANANGSYDYNVSGYNKYNREPGMISPDYNNNGTPKYSISQTSLQIEYNAMVESVDAYGGFFVARYELSYNNKGESKRNKSVTTASDSNTSMWYGLYDACKAMYNSETYNVQSGMVTGAQYDQLMVWMKDVPNGSKKFILDSSDMGNYGLTASVKSTGYSDNYCVKGIFDIAGNVEEWTTEAYDVGLNNARVARGGRKGVTGSSDPATDRVQSSDPTYTLVDQVRSSRPTLYIKIDE